MNRDKIYTHLLERYALGELPPHQMKQMKAALDQSSSLREQLNAISSSNESILKQYQKETIIRDIELKAHAYQAQISIRKQQRDLPVWYTYKWVTLTAVISCLLVAVPLMLHFNQSQLRYDDSLRIKGLQSHLNVYRKINQKPGAERLKNFDEVRKGDLLQVGYISEGKQFGVIVSLDGRGNVTLHFPDSLSGSSELDVGGEKLLSQAYELDDAPGFEHFFLVMAKDSFDISIVVNAVKKFSEHPETAAKGTLLKMPQKFKQDELILRKVSL